MTKHEDELILKNSIQPLLKDEHGTERFKENKIVSFLLDNSGFDMNKLATMDFSENDREHFAQLIGYSFDGFGTLPYVSDETYYLAEKQRRSSNAESEITELRKENAELKNLVTKNLDFYFKDREIDLMLTSKGFRAFALEQQAKGAEEQIKWFETHYPFMCDPAVGILTIFSEGLHNQAKQLKERTK